MHPDVTQTFAATGAGMSVAVYSQLLVPATSGLVLCVHVWVGGSYIALTHGAQEISHSSTSCISMFSISSPKVER